MSSVVHFVFYFLRIDLYVLFYVILSSIVFLEVLTIKWQRTALRRHPGMPSEFWSDSVLGAGVSWPFRDHENRVPHKSPAAKNDGKEWSCFFWF